MVVGPQPTLAGTISPRSQHSPRRYRELGENVPIWYLVISEIARGTFFIVLSTVLPYDKFDSIHMMIPVEMDLNVTALLRTRYTALDLMAQFGGFMGIFRWIFTTF